MLPFNRVTVAGAELDYVRQAIASGHLSGDGAFTERCQAALQGITGRRALLTHSCTGALEMAVLLADVGPGDEVILPSFTFVSTANAVALRGGVPVFVDIRPDTLNIDERLLEAAVTERTKAIIAVHYAGICAEMDDINAVAKRHGLFVIEDAAQALLSKYKGKPAGALGDVAAFSFHETKNIVSGEGGALIVGDMPLFDRAEILREKGTNRRQFLKGAVDKYTWVDLGSSYLPSELVAAFLCAQLEEADDIIRYRREIYDAYVEAFRPLAARGHVTLPVIPEGHEGNGHLFYLILNSGEERDRFIPYLKERGIIAPFHYVPLHSSPAGRRFGRVSGNMHYTEDISVRLVRLPLFVGLKDDLADVVAAVHDFFE